MAVNIKLQEKLKTIGLTDDEALIYNLLLAKGTLSVVALANESNINRTTTYRILESLASKKLIEWIVGPSGRKVKASSPENLQILIQEIENKLTLIKENYASVLTDIENISAPAQHGVQVKYYEGIDGLQQMLWNELQAEKEVLSYAKYGIRSVIDTKFYGKFLEEYVRRGIIDRSIINNTPEVLEYIQKYSPLPPSQETKHEVRYIDVNKLAIKTNVAIYNNVYAIYYYSGTEKPYGVEIKSQDVTDMQKMIFESMWLQASSELN